MAGHVLAYALWGPGMVLGRSMDVLGAGNAIGGHWDVLKLLEDFKGSEVWIWGPLGLLQNLRKC